MFIGSLKIKYIFTATHLAKNLSGYVLSHDARVRSGTWIIQKGCKGNFKESKMFYHHSLLIAVNNKFFLTCLFYHFLGR